MAELPKTFQDAVIVTRGLGLRYLWIDSLCILQDSMVEMQQEIQKTASVYGNATVTISATSAINSTSGFLARDPRPEPVVTLPFTQPRQPLLGSFNLYRRDNELGTWMSKIQSGIKEPGPSRNEYYPLEFSILQRINSTLNAIPAIPMRMEVLLEDRFMTILSQEIQHCWHDSWDTFNISLVKVSSS